MGLTSGPQVSLVIIQSKLYFNWNDFILSLAHCSMWIVAFFSAIQNNSNSDLLDDLIRLNELELWWNYTDSTSSRDLRLRYLSIRLRYQNDPLDLCFYHLTTLAILKVTFAFKEPFDRAARTINEHTSQNIQMRIMKDIFSPSFPSYWNLKSPSFLQLTIRHSRNLTLQKTLHDLFFLAVPPRRNQISKSFF